MVASTPEGEKATVTLLRKGEKKDIRIKIGILPSDGAGPNASHHPDQWKWGFTLEELAPAMTERRGLKNDEGVVVSRVQPGSPADLAGIQRGDIILEVNRKAVDSIKDVDKQIRKANDKDSLLLLVNRGKGSFFVGLSG